MPIIILLFRDNKNLIELERLVINTHFEIGMTFDHNLDN